MNSEIAVVGGEIPPLAPTIVQMKLCRRCGEEKPLDEFHVRNDRRCGRQPKCKKCSLEIRSLWREKNKDDEAVKKKVRERTAEWREKNPERSREAKKNWALNNPEKRRLEMEAFKKRHPLYDSIKGKKYALENAEKLRQWRSEHAVERRIRCANRRAQRKMAMPSWADKQVIAEFYKEANRLAKATGFEWHVDHAVPLKHNLVCGLHIPANLQLLPARVNLSKNNKFVVT